MSSYYQFQGPIQGGFGPSLDEEMRKRRKHSRDAGAPYGGGSSGIPTTRQRIDIGAQKAAAQQVFPPQPAAVAPPQQQPLAPRLASAVDLGAGPVQPQPKVDPYSLQGPYSQLGQAPYDPHRMIGRGPSPEPAAPVDFGKKYDDPDPRVRPEPRIPRRDPVPIPRVPQPPTGPPAVGPQPQAQRPYSGGYDKAPAKPFRGWTDLRAMVGPQDDPPRPPTRGWSVPPPSSGGWSIPAGQTTGVDFPMPTDPFRKDPFARRPPVQKPSVPDPFAAEREKQKSMGVSVPVRPGVDPSKEAEAKSIARLKQQRGIGRGYGRPVGRPKPGGFGPSRGGPGKPPPGGFAPPPFSAGGPLAKPKKKKGISWGKDQTREFTGPRFTPGSVLPWVPDESEKHRGYHRLGHWRGRQHAREEHTKELKRLQRRNQGRLDELTGRVGRRDTQIRQLQEGMGREGLGRQRAQKRVGQLLQEGRSLDASTGKKIRQLQEGMGREAMRGEDTAAQLRREKSGQLGREQALRSRYQAQIGKGKTRIEQLLQEGRGLKEGMGREGLAKQRAQERVGQLLQEGRSMESAAIKKIRALKYGMGREGIARQKAEESYRNLLGESNRNIQELEKKISDGTADRESAQAQIDALNRTLQELKNVPAVPKQDRDNLSELKGELADLKKAIRGMSAQKGAAPIVVQGGAGGGGASSSAGGSSASSGGGGAAPAAAQQAPDLSKIVEAVKELAEKGKAGKKGGTTKGITQARRTYTDKRKTKLAELRSLKSKRIREFNTKTKKLSKGERDKQRRAYKKKVEAQFKEMQQRFPTARGLKSVGVIRELIRKIDALKVAK